MIQFLKQCTFSVNDVFQKAFSILTSHYFSVLGLFLLLFITSNFSTTLAFYIQDYSFFLSCLMFIAFVVLYFGIQLTLFKYILRIIDSDNKVKISSIIPTFLEISNYFGGMLLGAVLSPLLIILALALICFPLIYLDSDLVYKLPNIVLSIGLILIVPFLLRIAFFPFFILDRNVSSYRSLRLSFALTRGNMTKILLILAVFGLMHLLQTYLTYKSYYFMSIGLSVLNSFFVQPLVSVVMAVAYKDMMADYKGGDNPSVLENII
ncbi:beta-carotene 15,15'-monooxygenase [Sphingobacterium hungaricum]